MTTIEHTCFELVLKAVKFEVGKEDRTCQLMKVFVVESAEVELEELVRN